MQSRQHKLENLITGLVLIPGIGQVKFSNYNFCHEFDFSITDFEYKEGKSIKDTFLDVTVD